MFTMSKSFDRTFLYTKLKIPFKMIAALGLLLVLLAAPTLEQDVGDPSLCPHVFMYGPTRARPGRWYGVVSLSTDSTLHSLWLNIVLDEEAIGLGNSVGKVFTSDNRNFRIENSAIKITPGLAVRVYFYVEYEPQNVIPRVLAIRLNGKEICNYFTKFTTPPPRATVSEITIVTATASQSGSSNSANPQAQRGCGKVVLVPQVTSGIPTSEEQWPWQAAIYRTLNVDNKYICGGTLISVRHVITAAHCVTRKSSKLVVDRHSLSAYLGKQNLRTSVDGVQISFVKEILVNPDYDAATFSSDVAILVLQQPLKYTDWVRPVCLWPTHDRDLNKVIGKEGTVVGWVFDNGGQVKNDLFLEKTSVVSQTTCINSHNNFFKRFASDSTYCAGNRNVKSPCPSAGSGMVFKSGDAWFLRGFVTLSVPKQNAFQCDPKYYAIFTDLAKFTPWINSIVSLSDLVM